jgi:hypothetical protein
MEVAALDLKELSCFTVRWRTFATVHCSRGTPNESLLDDGWVSTVWSLYVSYVSYLNINELSLNCNISFACHTANIKQIKENCESKVFIIICFVGW